MSVGRPHVRPDAIGKVTGTTRYPADGIADDALTAVVVFTGKPHARITELDISGAESVEGVVLVLTAADVPVNEYGLTMFDQPVLVGPVTTGRSAVPADISRWEADHLAVVVAESRDAAEAGAAAIDAVWEDLERVDDIDAALDPGAPLLHPENGLDTNDYHHLRIRRGDPDAGFADADVVVEGTYELPHQEHAYLQPEAASAWTDDDGRITVEVAGQWAHEDREQIAHALDLDEDAVRVTYPAAGGAFGGREDMSLQIVLALAAHRLHDRGIDRPVHCRWSREESIVGHHKRHRGRIRARLGARRDGTITALAADVVLDAGAYNYTTNKVLGNAHLSVAGPYRIPNARIDSRAVYTTTVPGGAFRGFGGPQGCFVAETQMNKLAAALGLDPMELRQRNVVHDGDDGITGTVLPEGVSISEVIEACSHHAALDRPMADVEPFSPLASLPGQTSAIRRGRGVAIGFKNVGFSFGFPERCEAEVVLHGDRNDDEPVAAELFHAAAEVGQGTHAALLQMTAEAAGVGVDAVTGHFSDTAATGDSGSVSASRMTFMAGNAILGAVETARKRWDEGDRPAQGHFRFVPPPTEPLDPETGEGVANFCYGYMAQAAEVSIDVETGHLRVDRVVSAHDVGRAVNPALVRGQVEGAIVQAHGYVTSEDLRLHDGMITNPRLSGYLIPGIGDVPGEVDSVILELGDPLGPFGARGMAEMPFLPYAPAVIAAVHDATGVWFDDFPLTPSRLLAGLGAAETPSPVTRGVFGEWQRPRPTGRRHWAGRRRP